MLKTVGTVCVLICSIMVCCKNIQLPVKQPWIASVQKTGIHQGLTNKENRSTCIFMGNKVFIINITCREWHTDLISYDCMMNNISLFLVLFVAMHANLMINLSDKAAIHSKLKSHVYGLPMISPHSSDMVTSSNRNIFRFTDPLCGEFTGHRWIPLTKASDAELWCFLWSAPEKRAEETITRLVIWDAIEPIMTSL